MLTRPCGLSAIASLQATTGDAMGDVVRLGPYLVRHYKGGIYQFLHFARDADNKTRKVAVYKQLWPHPPDYEFMSSDDFFGYVMPEVGDPKRRFQPITQEQADGLTGGKKLAIDRQQYQLPTAVISLLTP